MDSACAGAYTGGADCGLPQAGTTAKAAVSCKGSQETAATRAEGRGTRVSGGSGQPVGPAGVVVVVKPSSWLALIA